VAGTALGGSSGISSGSGGGGIGGGGGVWQQRPWVGLRWRQGTEPRVGQRADQQHTGARRGPTFQEEVAGALTARARARPHDPSSRLVRSELARGVALDGAAGRLRAAPSRRPHAPGWRRGAGSARRRRGRRGSKRARQGGRARGGHAGGGPRRCSRSGHGAWAPVLRVPELVGVAAHAGRRPSGGVHGRAGAGGNARDGQPARRAHGHRHPPVGRARSRRAARADSDQGPGDHAERCRLSLRGGKDPGRQPVPSLQGGAERQRAGAVQRVHPRHQRGERRRLRRPLG
jgi:hypothetical protein